MEGHAYRWHLPHNAAATLAIGAKRVANTNVGVLIQLVTALQEQGAIRCDGEGMDLESTEYVQKLLQVGRAPRHTKSRPVSNKHQFLACIC